MLWSSNVAIPPLLAAADPSAFALAELLSLLSELSVVALPPPFAEALLSPEFAELLSELSELSLLSLLSTVAVEPLFAAALWSVELAELLSLWSLLSLLEFSWLPFREASTTMAVSLAMLLS